MALTAEQTLSDCTAQLYNKGFRAFVIWSADDIQIIREDWTIEQCQEWLDTNESIIQDRSIEHGWEVIESIINNTDYSNESD